MCGIAGIIYKNGNGAHRIGRDMTSMLQSMKHRGPDSTGYALYHAPTNEYVVRVKLADSTAPRDLDFADDVRRRTHQGVSSNVLDQRYRLSGEFDDPVQVACNIRCGDLPRVAPQLIRPLLIPAQVRASDRDVLRVEHSLDETHDGHGLAELLLQIATFARTDPMLAGAGPVERQRALDESLMEGARLRDLINVGGVDENKEVEIAVSDMADERRQERRLFKIAARLVETSRQSRNGHANIRDDRF